MLNDGGHHHEDARDALAVSAMKNEMAKEACATHDHPSTIARKVREKHLAAKDYLSIPACIRLIQRKRKEIGRPNEPKSLEALAELLNTNAELKRIVHGNYKEIIVPPAGDPGCALLFINDEMVKELNIGRIIEIDDTMKYAIHAELMIEVPESTQMWIISYRKHNKPFAAAFAYCRGARAGLYEGILKRILQLARGLIDVELITTDFEKAALKACKNVFPGARVQGCWFHFIKALSGQ